MRIEDWLGADNTLGIDIWERKYRANGESFDEWLDRVSAGNETVKRLIVDKKFLFGGRILASRGLNTADRKTTYSNCYVIAPPEDNLESIFECASKLARTYSYGGGCGTDLSNLSPRGSKVRNAAKESSGAVSFMDLYSLVTGLISQNGRRGALMLSMDCDHPDIEEFIDIKKDLDKVTKANISVKVTDEFMEAVLDDRDWELSFTRKETGEVISKTVKAKELLMKLAYNNWDMGEPGILYWDRIKEWNLLSDFDTFSYAGVNPCVTGDTLVSTVNGDIQIRDLVDKHPYVYCMGEDGNIAIRQATKVWKTRENAKIVTVHTKRGNIKCTPDHLIFTRNRGWVAAGELRHGDRLVGLNRQMKDETHVAVGLSGGKYVPEHRLVAGHFYDIDGKDVHHVDGDTLNNTIGNLEVLSHAEHSRLSNTNRHIETIRNDKGQYVSKDTKAKRKSFNLNCGVGTNWTVDYVSWYDNNEDVYDMTVPGVHNFVANRIVVHNCAEEPLPAGGSCLLGSINLSEYVLPEGGFDFEALDEDVITIVAAMNDVLDEGLNLHPLQEQRDSVRDWRQIGIGVMGIADMLIKMGLRYGSSGSIAFCEEIARHILNYSLVGSADLAAANNANFPMYDYEQLRRSSFYTTKVYPHVDRVVRNNGLYNSQLLTIAPTGTLSTMLGISGGIEPIFANYYERKTESLHGEDVYYKVYTPIVKRYMECHGITDETDLPEYFVTAKDIEYKDRIAMQKAWQNYIDASISSTINLPHDATPEDVFNIYVEAWEAGLKGITVFREGCRRASILSTEEHKVETEKPSEGLIRGQIIATSDKLVGKKRKLITGCGSLHVTAFFDPVTGDLMETYFAKGSTGGCANSLTGLSRMISLAARGGCDIHSIVDQLNSCGVCPSYAVRKATKKDTSKGSCCPVAVGNALLDMWKEMQTETVANASIESSTTSVETTINDKPLCPECGEPLAHEGGCDLCKACGYSKCS